jgi:hypothetical protein
VRDCHVKLGEQNGILSCFVGVQSCAPEGSGGEGEWGPCGDGVVERRPAPQAAADDRGPARAAQSLSSPVDCVSNPCDPGCGEYDEVPPGGITVTPVVTGTYNAGSPVELINKMPPGITSKGLKSPCAGTADCQFDFHCVQGSCVPYEPMETIQGCNKPDLTVGVPCKLGLLNIVPVCNRGNVTAPAGVVLNIFPGNSPQYPTCVPDKNPSVCVTSAPIPPGECIDVANCGALKNGGVKTIMVNPPAPANAAWVDECQCANNWSAWHGQPVCAQKTNYAVAPLTVNQSYEATCDLGERVQWAYLAYDTSTPSDSSVTFAARTANTEADLDAASPVQLATARATPTPDTQVCGLGGPSPCPIDLVSALGDGFDDPFLGLGITLLPSADHQSAPTVND